MAIEYKGWDREKRLMVTVERNRRRIVARERELERWKGNERKGIEKKSVGSSRARGGNARQSRNPNFSSRYGGEAEQRLQGR